MSQDRIYVWDDEQKRLVPAWRPNAPGFARMAGYGGALVVGPSGNKREDMEKRAEAERLRKLRLKEDAA